MLGRGVTVMLGPEGLLCAPAGALLFADASEVPPSNKAAATTIRLGFVIIFHISPVLDNPIIHSSDCEWGYTPNIGADY
jgi:hypothetical protein